jgi:hypothetical protein
MMKLFRPCVNMRPERCLAQGGEIISRENVFGEEEWDAFGTGGVISKAGERECLVLHCRYKVPLKARRAPTMSAAEANRV